MIATAKVQFDIAYGNKQGSGSIAITTQELKENHLLLRFMVNTELWF
jgi:hypothetical protein